MGGENILFEDSHIKIWGIKIWRGESGVLDCSGQWLDRGRPRWFHPLDRDPKKSREASFDEDHKDSRVFPGRGVEDGRHGK